MPKSLSSYIQILHVRQFSLKNVFPADHFYKVGMSSRIKQRDIYICSSDEGVSKYLELYAFRRHSLKFKLVPIVVKELIF